MTLTPKQRAAWRHNAFLGHVRMMQMQLRDIINSPTTTDETKKEAAFIRGCLPTLLEALATRIDPQ